jgi:hypothetical protein
LVVAVVLALGACTPPRGASFDVRRTRSALQTIASAVAYSEMEGHIATNGVVDLSCLFPNADDDRQAYLVSSSILTDAWGRVVRCVISDDHIVVTSSGRDKQFESGDDIAIGSNRMRRSVAP